MRLTLRTLLAYVDDILEPSQAREIGAKISENSDAAKLMKRIREVLRRRRVGSPALAGPGSGPDPNVVAEYLDNTLPPALVQELERLCLESDIHLAEVAGSHKILSLVLSEPVEAPLDMRERMYVLGNVPRPAPVRPPEKVMEEANAPVDSDVGAAHFELQQRLFSSIEVGEMTDGIPDYLRRKSGWKRWAGVAVLCTLVIGWMCLVLFDPAIWPEKTAVAKKRAGSDAVVSGEKGAAQNPKLLAATGRPAKVTKPAPAPAADRVPSAPTSEQAVEAGPSAAEAASTAATSGESVAGSDAVAAVPPAGEKPAAELPPPPAEPKPAENSVAAETEVPGEAVAVAPGVAAPSVAVPPVPPATAMYINTEGILLVQSPVQRGWMVSPRRAIVHEGEGLAVPEPYVADLLLSDAERNEAVLELGIQSGTRLSLISAKGAGAVGIELHRGRVKVVRPQSSDEAARMVVRVDGRDWKLELLGPGTVCGIAVDLPQPSGPPGAMGPMKVGGGVLVVAGAIKMEAEGNASAEFRAGEGIVPWTSPGAPLVARLPSGIPDWLTPEGVVMTPTAKSYARSFEKEFSLEHPASVSIPPVIKDRQAKIAELATRTVALLGEYKDLASALHSEHEEARLAAIDGLREWLPQAPENVDLLRQELTHFFPEDQVDVIVRLLWGFSIQDAHNPDISQQLVGWMGDDDITIRELAFYHVFRLTGRRDGYRPNLPLSFRQAAVLRWEEHVRRMGALLGG